MPTRAGSPQPEDIFGRPLTRRAALAAGLTAAAGTAALAAGIGCDDGPDKPATPRATATSEALPTPTPELGDRPLMIPQEIQAPPELVTQLKKELGENTEVLHYYQGEYNRFGFLMDPRLRTRTTKTTDFGFARGADSSPVTTLSDFKLSDENLQRYTGQTMPIGELVKRMENVFLLLTVNEMRDEPDFKDVFPVFDPGTDPFDLTALARIKELIRTRKEPRGLVNGIFIDPAQDRFLKIDNDNPGGRVSGGFGYGRKSLQEGKYKGSEVVEFWFQTLSDEAFALTNIQQRLDQKLITVEQFNSYVNAVSTAGVNYLAAYSSTLLSTIGNKTLRELADSRMLANATQLGPLGQPYRNQLSVNSQVGIFYVKD
jgi:hypothetical protein